MGKKSRRNHPAAALRTRLFDTVLRLFNADIESNYCHLDPVCDGPVKCFHLLYASGTANMARSQEKDSCLGRAIQYFEMAIKLINSIQEDEE